MTRVHTQPTNGGMRFTQRNGQSVTHPQEFTFKSTNYCFLGGVYYDLEDDLINHIFGAQPCNN